jgi:hypothetical protein
MHCRKVRSLLSAACSDELDSRLQAVVKDHLASCPSCRKEASYYSSLRLATRELPKKTLSEDFNARLLNRISQERFQETRTRAYLPRRAPRLTWRTLTPVLVTACLALVVVGNFLYNGKLFTPNAPTSTLPTSMDDRYLTAQPGNNPNLAVGLRQDWSLKQQLARAERLEQISRGLANQYGFGNMYLTSGTMTAGSIDPTMSPFFLRQQPVYRVYRLTGSSDGRGGSQAY